MADADASNVSRLFKQSNGDNQPRLNSGNIISIAISVALSAASSAVFGSFEAGKITQQVSTLNESYRAMNTEMAQFMTATEQLSVGIASLNAQMTGLHDAVVQERQDRLNEENRENRPR